METVGSKLKAAREAKDMTVTRIAELTRIKSQQILGIEKDDYSTIPAPMYVKGFIKLYAQEVDLDPVPLLEAYEESVSSTAPRKPGPTPRNTPATAPSAKRPEPREPKKAPGARPMPVAKLAEKRAAVTRALNERLKLLDPGALRKVALPAAVAVLVLLVLVLSLRSCARQPALAEAPENGLPLRDPYLVNPIPLRFPLPESPE